MASRPHATRTTVMLAVLAVAPSACGGATAPSTRSAQALARHFDSLAAIEPRTNFSEPDQTVRMPVDCVRTWVAEGVLPSAYRRPFSPQHCRTATIRLSVNVTFQTYTGDITQTISIASQSLNELVLDTAAVRGSRIHDRRSLVPLDVLTAMARVVRPRCVPLQRGVDACCVSVLVSRSSR